MSRLLKVISFKKSNDEPRDEIMELLGTTAKRIAFFKVLLKEKIRKKVLAARELMTKDVLSTST